jgi:DNA-binding beta-propeller fold protein YncE
VAHPQIAAFARLADRMDPPVRTIAGQATKLARTMHDIRYDATRDEIVVPNQFAQAILTFPGGATGETPPLRVIQGPLTQLQRPDRLDIDTVHGEIFVPNTDSIVVFSREANGNVAPLRVIKGPKTLLSGSSAIAVDPVRNLIIASSRVRPAKTRQNAYTPATNTLLIFNRTDSGDVAPRGVIQGDHTGLELVNQLQVYAPKGWVVVTQTTTDLESEPPGIFIGVWSVEDSGDVAPRWKIAGPRSRMKKPRGVALNPAAKEIIVADMRVNAVSTYSLPGMF